MPLIALAAILSLLDPAAFTPPPPGSPTLTIEPVGTLRLGPFLSGAAEIVAHDPATHRLFVVNGAANAIYIVSIEDPARPVRVGRIDAAPFGGGVNSVAVHEGLVATAVAGFVKTDPGKMVLFSTDGAFIAVAEVGSLPDMVCFTPDGRFILTANEGEPSDDYSIDPEGSVSVIEVPDDPRRLGQRHARTADFRRFNGGGVHPDIRVFGPNATPAQDLEPEYIAVSADSATAYVTLQENNALAVVDIAGATVTGLFPLGFKDHSLPGNALDASDRAGAVDIRTWPVLGMYQPDTIDLFVARDGRTYLVTADEGDTRGYPGFDETARVKDLTLDPEAFPDAETLHRNDQLGRLEVARAMGDDDADGRHECLFAYGARGFSIRDTSGSLVFDSGDAFERITAERAPTLFNTDNVPDAVFKNRSDNRGPEPEALTLGRVGGRDYAFIGLERTGGIMIYDITVPAQSTFVHYWTNRDPDPHAETGDLGPECLLFIPSEKSPTGEPLLVSANEISGTLTLHRLAARPMPRP
jgi:hypothetical protein